MVGGRGVVALITLTTDFGLTDPFVGIMKGVIATRAPGMPVVDVTHGVPPQDVRAGAMVLRAAAPYFPFGSVHVAVVDPGVGSARRAICVVTATGFFVGPDNGVLSLAAPPATRTAVHALADDRFFLSPRSRTFHGRDVFAPVAAALATGTLPSALGPPVTDPTELVLPEPRTQGTRIVGEVVYVDHFGNLVTNIPGSSVDGAGVVVLAGNVRAALVNAYADGSVGQPIALVNSWDLLEVAVRDGSAHQQLGIGVGAPVTLEPR